MDGDVLTLILDGVEVNTTWEGLAERVLSTTTQSFSSAWLVLRAAQIFLVQIGMLLLEIGSVSPKNTKTMILKNIGNSSVSAICFYLLGYGFSFGEQGDDFIGWAGFATKGSSFSKDGVAFAHFFYYFCLLNLVPSIVSGSLSERTNVVAYFVITFFISIFISPVIMHWAWSEKGWASNTSKYLMSTGVLDFAGSSVVHISGGIMALVGAYVVGPRKGRFSVSGKKVRMPRGNVTYAALGAFFIWAGFYSLNMGTLLSFSSAGGNVLGRIAINTTVCATMAAVTVSAVTLYKEKSIDPYSVINGLCAGLAGSSAGCATMTTEGALVTGCFCGALYFLLSSMLCSFQIDDVTDVCPIHLGGGLVGSITAALFTTPELYKMAFLGSGEVSPCGAFYVCEGLGWRQLVANLIFLVVVSVWSLAAALALFLPLRVMSLLRVDKLAEDAGLDFFAESDNLHLKWTNQKL